MARYAAFETLVAPARPSADPWRLLAGLGLTAVLFMALSFLYSGVLATVMGQGTWESMSGSLSKGTTPAAVLINLFIFGMLILAIWGALRVVHGRGLISVIGPPGVALRQFGRVCVALMAVYLLVGLLPLPEDVAPVPNLDPRDWIALLPLGLAGLVVQTSAEEIAFRGYMQSQLAARFGHPAVWIVVPSVAFALLHYAPGQMGDSTWAVVIWAALFGVAAADLTARSGTLGPAIAMHLINNTSAILFTAPQGNFDGLALYTYPFSLESAAAMAVWLPLDVMALFCSWLAARLALRR
ncbi:CPBP family intramembrane glutamic endopeptidase [Roseovarius salinarum]|uniref:CPBP family intramembrane glutamic endopeptidase n=1 Tax=Roseovarius salinarum TaxID=1981892 RepID=UPI000C3455B6|nr:type II CAAX endopeptidase family protein [Roseovarius salinarum]